MSKGLLALGTLGMLTLGTPAHAAIYSGNPATTFRIDRPQGDLTDGDVNVYKLRIHYCGGGYTDYSVKQWVDPVDGFSVTINGGNLCSATVFWDSDIVLHGNGFEIVAEPTLTSVSLDPIKDADVLPWHVTEGNPGAGTPQLLVELD
ncbi:MAG: hypothetical protein H6736_24700 [Alphaproteobacteria bacterium]|nr:hypothetical protein [Alphaproteobacteria bacterium]MCB9695016.1 hypothetical protein [Alphaproteobacteria bacterium]